MVNLFGKVEVAPLQSGDDLLLNGSLNNVHKDWLPQVKSKIRAKYQNEDNFAIKYALDWQYVHNFARGNLVETSIFKTICGLLELNWQEIQQPLQKMGE